MKIKNVEINGYAALAPMAGAADKAFREMCKSYGAAYTVSEMVSAKGVSMGDRKSASLMSVSDTEHPCAVQIFGTDPEIMAKSAVEALNYNPDIIDINMGCPAPKIIKGGAGSALMKNPGLAGKIIKSVSEAVEIPVTVKIRTGWDSDNINAVDMALIAEENGAAAITVHGRTKEQMYAPGIDIETISKVKQSVKIPVIANGDIDSVQAAALMYERTGCDLIMVGRGALGRPWIFSQINAYLSECRVLPNPPVTERMLVMLRHVEKICAYSGERIGLREARKHALWYTKGIRGAAEYRRQLSTIQTLDELKSIAFLIAAENQ